MKSLLLAATAVLALSSGSTHAASPSAPLTITVSRDHAPAVPPQAAAAGFTTLALDSDFTTMSLSQIGCAIDGSSNGSSGWAYNGGSLPTNPIAGCGTGAGIYFGTDQGSQALFVHWQSGFDSYSGCGAPNYICNISLSTRNNPTTLPLNSYVEITARYTTPGAAAGQQWAFWSWPVSAGAEWLERDFIEQLGNSGPVDYDIIYWSGGQVLRNVMNHYPVDSTQYHTYGYLMTGNSAQTQVSATGYLDNNVISNGSGCQTCVMSMDPTLSAHRDNFLEIQQIPQAYPATYTADLIVKSVRVWTCANWQTTNCFQGQ
jgi:hypothetical protein